MTILQIKIVGSLTMNIQLSEWVLEHKYKNHIL
jgi:hypothetical protein